METESHPSDTILGALEAMAALTSTDGQLSTDAGVSLGDGSYYGYILGIEKTPHNILFGQAIVVSFFLQFMIFYAAWFLCPSLNRRGLAWILTLFSAIVLLTTTSFELGYLRITLWHLLGWEQNGPDAATATIFTYWVPAFHSWVFQLGSTPGSLGTVTLTTLKSSLTRLESARHLLSSPQAYKDLAGEYLRWLITLPVFSLAPLKPTQLFSETAPYYLGGGGRLLFSMENFPRETWFSSVLCGYFVGYCIGDLLIGQLHYKDHIDPISGWAHHVIYTWLIYQLCKKNMLSVFLIAGGLLELSTVFLALGYMFPYLREDFWFPTTFFLVRIFFVSFMWHEIMFNYPSPMDGMVIYSAALMMHNFWFSKYLQGRRRRMLKAKETPEKEKIESMRFPSNTNGIVASSGVSTATSVSGSKAGSTFQLRVKKDK